MKLGFLGLGIMGTAMARNLVKAGFDVTVWNRNADKCRELVEAGAQKGATPKEVASSCDITFAMLADPAAAEAVCFGRDGVVEGINGRGYVDMSTVDAATSIKIAAAITAQGGRYLEAPVSGSKKPAEDGTLIILAAGDRSLYDDALSPFGKLGKKTLYLGEVGQGAKMKLVVNMLMGGMMTIFCEGLALGEKAGIGSAEILDVIEAGAMANPMFKLKGGSIGAGNFAPAFPLKHMQKDMKLALALGEQLEQPLFTAAIANELFKKAKTAGFSDEDFSAVFKTVRK